MIKTAMGKMLNNKWLYSCLLIGLVLVVAFISCIPMYTQGVLQRVLTKDLEKIQAVQGVYPGKYWASVNIGKTSDASTFSSQFYKYRDKLSKELFSQFNLDAVSSTAIVGCSSILFTPSSPEKEPFFLSLNAMEGIEEHINLVYGEMMSDKGGEDYDFEAMMNQYTYSSRGFEIGEIYTISSNLVLSKSYKIKVVGVFSVPGTADPFWPETDTYSMNDCVYLSYGAYTAGLIGNNSNNAVTSATFYHAIDYSKITLDDVEPILNAYSSLEEYVSANSAKVTLRFPLIETVRQYSGKIATLNVLFLLLQIPVFLMLAFYIYMVAGLISNMDRDEIAVLKSRGATNSQIFKKYTVEMGLLCLVAALIGPFLGLFLSKFLGSSNGFLEFVNRSALNISLSPTVYLYVICAVIVCLVATLIPVFSAARYNIVHMKRSKGATTKMPLWQKMGADVILLGISIYGYISRRSQTGVASSQLWSDPIIFILSATFILGAGLLFVRIYPYILRLIFRLTRSVLPPSLYLSFNHVARGSGKNTFLMLFLVMTLTVGLFSANAARSINTRQERVIRHLNGADVVISEVWQKKETPANSFYVEPPINRFTSVEGLSDPTRVVINKSFKANISNEIRDAFITVMAIEPYGFSKVVSTYPSQYKGGINSHIATLYAARNAAIISSSLAADRGLKVGDTVTYHISDTPTEFYIADIVESWPGIDHTQREYFIITGYDHYKAHNTINNYFVWLNRDESVATQDIYEALSQGNFNIKEISVASQLIADAKNDPAIQGTNGVLTLGFLISVCISIAGFLIFWILSVRERVLQFGLLGAMGLPMRSILSILAIEQALISLVSVLAGVVIGYFTSVMYIPFIGSVYATDGLSEMFTLMRSAGDYTKIYAIVIFMLILACAALGITVKRINLTQALKLGED